jgi:hypothetical protein
MLELRILTGLHRGAALPLDGEAIHIGSASENDLVLVDPGMPALAGVIQRSAQSSWVYRAGHQAALSAQPSLAASPAAEVAIAAGARWFAGPVLIGCEDERTPWGTEPALPSASCSGKRSVSLRTKAIATALTILAAAGGAALWGKPSIATWTMHALAPDSAIAPEPARSADMEVGDANQRSAAALALPSISASPSELPHRPPRVVKAAVYPTRATDHPPFRIRSASGGPYGFIVTDDGHVLTPGSRWRAFTLVRIEPGRAVFTGPYAAELTW